jgi:rhamnose transport system substrate-binding protein/rhamnose transport system permease protein
MNKNIKKLLLGSVSILMVTSMLLAGCGVQTGQPSSSTNASGKSSGKKTIAMVPKVIGSPYFDIAADGAKQAGKDLGVNIIYDGPTSADAAQQVNIIQDLITKKVDAIAVSPNDPSAVAPILKKARAAGIKVLTYDSDSNKDARDIFVDQVSAEALGRHIMDNVTKEIGGKGEFAILTASLTAFNQNTWIKWMKVQLKDKYPDIKLDTIAPSEEDQQKALSQTENLIKAYPNLKAIAALSTVAEPGAAQAIEQMGMAGKVKLVGLATPSGMKQFLKSGAAQSATLWDPKKLGYLTISIANDLLNGKTPSDGEDVKNVGKIKYITSNNEVIMGDPLDFTKDNVDQFGF